MRIKITTESLDTLGREGLALGFFLDDRPPKGHCGFVDWRLNGMISREIASGHISAAFMEKIMIASSPRIPASKILLMGMGLLDELTDDKLYHPSGCQGRGEVREFLQATTCPIEPASA